MISNIERLKSEVKPKIVEVEIVFKCEKGDLKSIIESLRNKHSWNWENDFVKILEEEQ